MTGDSTGINENGRVADVLPAASDSNKKCFSLAIEGERSCRAQDHEKGLYFVIYSYLLINS